jgi:hypothetical protein
LPAQVGGLRNLDHVGALAEHVLDRRARPRVTEMRLSKHGRYTAEADASRRELAALLRSIRALASSCVND